MAISRLSETTLQTGFQKFNTLWDSRSAVGAMEAISSVTVSSATPNIDFNNIPQTYSHLHIKGFYFCSSTVNPYLRLGDSSIDVNGNYSWHHLYGDGASVYNNGGGSASFIYYGYSISSTSPNIAIIDILNYSSTNKSKTVKILAGQDNNGSGELAIWSGTWQNSSTGIQSIRFITGSGNINQFSQFTLYGVK